MDTSPEPETTPPEPKAELDVEGEHQRLDELGEKIENTRRQAEHDLHPEREERRFAESGEEGTHADDQTIAPG